MFRILGLAVNVLPVAFSLVFLFVIVLLETKLNTANFGFFQDASSAGDLEDSKLTLGGVFMRILNICSDFLNVTGANNSVSQQCRIINTGGAKKLIRPAAVIGRTISRFFCVSGRNFLVHLKTNSVGRFYMDRCLV